MLQCTKNREGKMEYLQQQWTPRIPTMGCKILIDCKIEINLWITKSIILVNLRHYMTSSHQPQHNFKNKLEATTNNFLFNFYGIGHMSCKTLVHRSKRLKTEKRYGLKNKVDS
jgi:hypothetical protein